MVNTDTLLIRRLPAGTKSRLAAQAKDNERSVEAEAREILIRGLGNKPTLHDLMIGQDHVDTSEVTWEPERLGINLREVEW